MRQGQRKVKRKIWLIYDEKYIKAKVREFNGVIKTHFLGDKILKENVHYTCVACITIDSVRRMEKKRIIHKFIWKSEKIE